MADEEVIGLGVDVADAIAQIKQLQKSFDDLGKSGRNLRKAGADINTFFRKLEDGSFEAVQTFKSTAQAIDEVSGKIVSAKFSGNLEDGITNVTTSVRQGRQEWGLLKKQIEETLRASIELAKQNAGLKVSPTVPAREAFIPRTLRSNLNPEALDKASQAYANIIAVQGRVNLSTRELNEVTKAFLANKPNEFIGGQKDVYAAMVKTREVVKKLKQEIADPGRIEKFNDRFSQIIAPRLPKIDKSFGFTKSEENAAKKAFVDLQEFAVNKTEITRREYDLLFKRIKEGAIASLNPTQQEFVKLFKVAEDAYNRVGEAARTRAGKSNVAAELRAEESKLAAFEARVERTRQNVLKAVLQNVPKVTAELPQNIINPKAFDVHEKALSTFNKILKATKLDLTDVERIINQVGAADGPGKLVGSNLRLYDALQNVLKAEADIENQAIARTNAEKQLAQAVEAERQKRKNAAREEAIEIAKAQKASQFVRRTIAPPQTISVDATRFAPEASEKFRQQLRKLDQTLLDTKSNVDIVKTAIRSLNETDLTALAEGKPEGFLRVRDAVLSVRNAQEEVTRATERNIVREEQAKAKALGRAAAVVAAEKEIADAKNKQQQLAAIQRFAQQDLAQPQRIEAQRVLDPRQFEAAQLRINAALDKVHNEIPKTVRDFDDYKAAVAASTDPAAISVLEPRLRNLANLIRKATTEQLNFNAAAESAATKQKRQDDILAARRQAFAGPLDIKPFEGADPKLFERLRNQTLAYQQAVVKAKLSTEELGQVSLSLNLGKIVFDIDDSRLLSVHEAARNLIITEERIIEQQANISRAAQVAGQTQAQELQKNINFTRTSLALQKEYEAVLARFPALQSAASASLIPQDIKDQPKRVESIRLGYIDLAKTVKEAGLTVEEFNLLLVKFKDSKDITQGFTPQEQPVVAVLAKIKNQYIDLDRTREEIANREIVRQDRVNKKIHDANVKAIQDDLRDKINAAKSADVVRVRDVARRELRTPETPSLKLDDKVARQAIDTIKTQFRNLDSVVANTQDGFTHFQQALASTQGVVAFENLSVEAKKMAPILESIIRQNAKLEAAERGALEVAKQQTIEAKRQLAGQKVIETRVSDVPLPVETTANRNKIEAFHKSVRDLRAEFVRSKADAEDLDAILARLAAGEKFTVSGEFAKLEEAAIRVNARVRDLGVELAKTGQGIILKSLKDLRDEFRLSGATVEQFKSLLKSQVTGTPFSGKIPDDLTDLNEKIKEVIASTKTHGDAAKDEAALVAEASASSITAIEAEIDAINKRARDRRRDAADRKRQRKLDAEENQAAVKEAIRERTEQRQKTFPTVTGAFPAIPSFAQTSDVTAVNAGFAAITNTAIKANLSAKELGEQIKIVRAQLAQPIGSQIFAPLSPEMEKVRAAIIQTENAFKGIETPAARAGKGILISWQGVFRLFQAQVLHTALSQIIADFRQAITEVGNFQREVGLIRTITQDAANAETTFDQWSNSIVRLANELGKTPTEIATASYDALSNQITTTKGDTEAFVRTAGEFARTTGATTPDAVNLLSSAITSYGLTAADAESVSAKFFATIDLGRVKASDLANSYGRVTALSSALGVSIDELNAGLVVLTQQGVKAPDALTQLNAVFSKLLKPTEATKELFKELGVASGESLIAAEGFGGALALIAKAAEEGKGDFTEFFNELRSARGGFTLAKNGAEQFRKALADLSVAQDKFQTAKPLVVAPPGVQLQQQLNELKNLITEDFGAEAAATIVRLTDSVGTLPAVFRGAFNQIKVVIQSAIDTIKLFAEATQTTPGAISTFIVALVAAKSAILGLSTATVAFSETVALAFSTHPVLAAIAATAALGLSISYIKNQYAEVEREAFDSYATQIDGAAKTSAEITASYTKAVGEQTQIQQDGIRKQLGEFSKFASEATKSLQIVANEYKTFGEEVKRALEVAFGGVNDVLKNQISETERGVTELKNSIEKIGKFQVDAVQDFNKDAFERRLSVAPPQQKDQLIRQRIGELGIEAIKLFNEDNIDEALNTFKEINKLDKQRLDLFPKAQLAQIKLQDRQQTNQQFQNQPVALNETRTKLNAALLRQTALMGQVATNEKEALTLTARRIQATQEINNLINQANSVKRSKGEIAETNKLVQLYQQLRGSGLSREQTEVEVAQRMGIQNQVMEQGKKTLRERVAIEEQNVAVQKANLRNVELLQEALNKVKVFEASGELVSDKQLVQAADKLDLLKGQLIEAIRTAGEQGAIPIELIGPKTAAVQQQVEALQKSIEQQVDQAKKIDFKTTAENRFKEAVNASNAEITKQNKLVVDITKGIDEAARKAQALGGRLAGKVEETFDPGIISSVFDKDVIPRPASTGGVSDPTQERQIAAFKELMALQERIKSIGPFELKTPAGSKAAVTAIEAFSTSLEKYAKLVERPELLDKEIKLKTPSGGEALVKLKDALIDLGIEYRKIRDQVQEKINAEGIVETTRKITEARSLQAVVPEGGSIRRIAGQESEALDALGNVTARIPKIAEDYVKAYNDAIKKINSLVPLQKQMELQLPTELRQPQLIGPSKPPLPANVPVTNPAAEELLRRLSEPVPVKADTKPIESSLNDVKINAGLVFQNFGLEQIQAVVDKIRATLIPALLEAKSLQVAAIPEAPNPNQAVAGPTGFRTAIAAVALGQTPQDQPITPINPIDTVAAINSINQIKLQLAAMFSQGIGFNNIIPIAEITMGLNQIQQTITQTNTTFLGFSMGAVGAIRSIASVIVNELIPAIQSAQATLNRLNATPVRSAAPAKAAATGGVQYFARGGTVPVMTTPGELFFDPDYTRKHRRELETMNRYKVGGVSKGSDTELMYLQPGTFVLNKRASEYFFKDAQRSKGTLGPKGMQYLYTGGMTNDTSFTTKYVSKGFTSNNSSSSSNLDMSNMTINVQGGSNVSTEALAIKLGKSIQRQVRIGRLKGN